MRTNSGRAVAGRHLDNSCETNDLTDKQIDSAWEVAAAAAAGTSPCFDEDVRHPGEHRERLSNRRLRFVSFNSNVPNWLALLSPNTLGLYTCGFKLFWMMPPPQTIWCDLKWLVGGGGGGCTLQSHAKLWQIWNDKQWNSNSIQDKLNGEDLHFGQLTIC